MGHSCFNTWHPLAVPSFPTPRTSKCKQTQLLPMCPTSLTLGQTWASMCRQWPLPGASYGPKCRQHTTIAHISARQHTTMTATRTIAFICEFQPTKMPAAPLLPTSPTSSTPPCRQLPLLPKLPTFPTNGQPWAVIRRQKPLLGPNHGPKY